MTTTTETKHVTLCCAFCLVWNRVDAARAADRPKCGKCARPMLLDRPIPLDDETFERTIAGSDLPVLVDFYADWCQPCKVMAPAVDELARQHQGRALVAKLNTEVARQTAARFRIAGIPTTIVFRGGQEVARRVGAMPLAGLQEMLK